VKSSKKSTNWFSIQLNKISILRLLIENQSADSQNYNGCLYQQNIKQN